MITALIIYLAIGLSFAMLARYYTRKSEQPTKAAQMAIITFLWPLPLISYFKQR